MTEPAYRVPAVPPPGPEVSSQSLPPPWWVRKALGRPFVRHSLENPVDTSILRQRPSGWMAVGLGLLCLGSLMGVPTIAVLTVLSVEWESPLIAAIGAPLSYGLSFPVFSAGAYLAGKGGMRYAETALRLAVRVLLKPWAGQVQWVWAGAKPWADEGQ